MGRRLIPLWEKASDPDANDDITSGIQVGDYLKNTVSEEIFVCEDNTDTAADWKSLTNALGSISSAITPTESGDLDDYNPTGLADANQIIINNTGNNEISGLTAPSPAVRKRVGIFVKGSGRQRVKDNNGSSVAANRILTGGNIDVSADQAGIILEYDTDVSRWRFMGKM